VEEYPRVIYGHDAGGTPRCAAVDENGVLNVRLSENSAGTLSVSAVSVAAVSGWKSAAIEVLEDDDLSGSVDLGEHFRYLAVIMPALTPARVGVHVAPSVDGAYVPLGNGAAAQTDLTSGAHATVFDIGGWRYVKLSTSVAQAEDRVFSVQGVRG